MAGHINGPDHYFFAANKLNQVHGHMRVVALQRDDIDTGFLQLGESLFILSPLRAQGLFPIGIGLDAIAIANMHSRFTLKAFNCPFQGGNPPVIHLIEEHIKGGLIKLDNINPRRF